ncbi:MAG: 3'(2'),5'-bisphosphate nucleotidase CysQ [Myxococcales bacterium]|nr:3'(2'),5'-bisphosphate nucleotidase CysQ [Myxococcales bacterium]
MLERELETATRLAREAGKILLEIYASDFDVDFKGARDPVTEADRRANDFLVAELRRAFPDDGVVAEESPEHGDALLRERCWFVDPLDGTKEFVARNGEFSVMLGLAVEGRSRLGVVYQAAKDKLYRGVVGGQAVLEQDGQSQLLCVSDIATPSKLSLVVSRSHRSRSIDAIRERLGIDSERPSGSVGLKVGHLAEQNADLYVHLSDRSCKWDACGPEAILLAAGGRFTDCFGRAMRYDEAQLQNLGGILACNAAAFESVLETVGEVAREMNFGQPPAGGDLAPGTA